MNPTRIPRTLLRFLAAVVVAGLALAACGTDEESSSPSTTDDAAAANHDAGTPSADADDDAVSTTSTGSTGESGVPTSAYLDDYQLEDTEFGTMTTVTVADGTRTIETNALPNHETGEFPNEGNPNTISAQDLTWEFPSEGTWVGEASVVRTTGVALNGVKFEPATAESVSCSTGETYRVEALQDLYDLGLDFNNAHVQPTGEYHYHGVSQMLVDAYDDDVDLVHVGFASDGYLIYYSKSGAYASSYALSADTRSGTDCEMSLPGGSTFDLDGTTPDGTYSSDYTYDPSNGDLDECNGTTIDGEYVYLITDSYPYIGRCVMGEASADAGGGAPGGAGVPGGAPENAAAPPDGGGAPGPGGQGEPVDGPDFSEAAATLGVSEADLVDALGFPPDVSAAAETLGIDVAALVAVLPAPPAGAPGV